MAQARFDPSSAVKFDLSSGQITLGSDPRLLVPSEALLDLALGSGPDASRDFAHKLGTEVGRRVASRLGQGVSAASLADVVEHLGGDLALLGVGSLSAERWGAALVLTVTRSPFGARGDGVVAGVVEAALRRAMGRDATCVPIMRDGDSVRLLVASAATAELARGWLASGTSWGDVLTRLNAGADA